MLLADKELDRAAMPLQPDESAWTFVDELRTAPYHRPVTWTKRGARQGEVAFPAGVRFLPDFTDPTGGLDTAVADFRFFLQTVGLADDGAYPLVTRRISTSVREAFRIRIGRDGCELGAADSDGIRRGLVWIEDELLRRGGPFLPLGTVTRKPVIRTRLARCFYGPINRPPKCRDELADDVDYYPEEYLNRLAHMGVNGLWLTLHFFNTVPSRIIPEYGRDAGPRLAKLRRTVAKCARYGIRIYPFCIEPAGFTWPHPEIAAAAKAHPDLIGHNRAFCTSTAKGQAYLEEATRTLFSEVPGLGGLIVIPVGENVTHCYSMRLRDESTGGVPNQCPRCSRSTPFEVFRNTLAGLARGMRSADPAAELIAWPYGQFIGWGHEKTVKAAEYLPKGAILQHNFETGGLNRQLGRRRPTWDYWLSYAGPSELFRDCARAARKSGTRVFAKLQVGCSHEVATTQVVPVPGILFTKFTAMHALEVSGAMYSWYFGAYPSFMTRAASELAFAPLPASANAFLSAMARRDWGAHAGTVVRAWRWFERGYANYPTAHLFGYYGPMHDGPVWPLHLIPKRLPLAPTWLLGYPPSGDYIAECVANGFTLREMVTLCGRMAAHWDRGVQFLTPLRQHFREDPERLRDIGIAQALGLQFRSGFNILSFYALREKLAEARAPAQRRALLQQMKALVRAELEVDAELLPLAEADSCLGFHSEAEGYKYFPALIRWRMRQLRRLLATEFPAVARRARRTDPLFPDYTGEIPAGAAYTCARLRSMPAAGDPRGNRLWDGLPETACRHWLHHVTRSDAERACAGDGWRHRPVPTQERLDRRTSWQSACDADRLYFRVRCTPGAISDPDAPFDGNGIELYIEPCRTRPRILFMIGADGSAQCLLDDGAIPNANHPWRLRSWMDAGDWCMQLSLPFRWLGAGCAAPRHPLRVNVVRYMPLADRPGITRCSWANQQPVESRLGWGFLNPATDFGWLRFRRTSDPDAAIDETRNRSTNR